MVTLRGAHDPWFVPMGDSLWALQREVEKAVGPTVGPNPMIVAKCRHCACMVLLEDHAWVLVDLSAFEGLADGDAPPELRRFPTAADVLAAMQDHPL